MTFDNIEVLYYDDTDGSCFQVGPEYMFKTVLPNMNGAESIQFENNGIKYLIFGNDEGPYKVIMHNDNYEFYREIYLDAHEAIAWLRFVEGGLR